MKLIAVLMLGCVALAGCGGTTETEPEPSPVEPSPDAQSERDRSQQTAEAFTDADLDFCRSIAEYSPLDDQPDYAGAYELADSLAGYVPEFRITFFRRAIDRAVLAYGEPDETVMASNLTAEVYDLATTCLEELG